MNPITKASHAFTNIATLPSELAKSRELVDRLRKAKSWYLDARDPDHPAFGWSTFIGFKSQTAATYLQNSDGGRYSEADQALKRFREKLEPGTPEYEAYHEKLSDWLNGFDKRPAKGIRLFTLKPDPEDVG